MKFKDAWELIQWRKRNYQKTFGTPEGRAVLADLAKFCRATETCFHPDPRVHAVLEGRRETFLRISKLLNLTTDQLMKEFGGIEWQRQNQQDE